MDLLDALGAEECRIAPCRMMPLTIVEFRDDEYLPLCNEHAAPYIQAEKDLPTHITCHPMTTLRKELL